LLGIEPDPPGRVVEVPVGVESRVVGIVDLDERTR
jgi:hypothetical protein